MRHSHVEERFSIALPADATAARAARREVQRALARGGELVLLDRALVIVSELATNAVRYAAPPVLLTLRAAGRYVSIAVHDRSAALPEPATVPDLHGESGRGMLLVQALADESGQRTDDDGKVIWARLEAPDTTP